jgi:hypothetical protein
MGRSRKRHTVSRRLLLAWALGAATTGCTHTYAGRWIVWNRSGVEDHLRFPSRPVEAAPALLVGIALDRGHIRSVDDPVTAYLLAGGTWDGERVVSREWLDESTRIEPGCELEAYRPRRVCYRRAWWLYPADGDEPRTVAATGHLGQYLFVFPDQEVVIVRFGRKPGGVHWPTVFRSIVRALEVDGVA